jgi:hypothetical protein
MTSSIHKRRAIRRKAAAKYRETHPASVRTKMQRYGHLQKSLMRWARRNMPQLVRQFEREAMRLFPACLVDEDYEGRR